MRHAAVLLVALSGTCSLNPFGPPQELRFVSASVSPPTVSAGSQFFAAGTLVYFIADCGGLVVQDSVGIHVVSAR